MKIKLDEHRIVEQEVENKKQTLEEDFKLN